ncbi:MAG: ATP-binding protein [Candidatus Peribacteraceae bacterium]|nr:ATP-binding protein [Candidatus Peribacteraceae bacterium]
MSKNTPKGTPNDFFTSIQDDTAYVKIAIQGSAGTGKSFTSAALAIGISKALKTKLPVVIFNNERSTAFLKEKFAEQGVECFVKQSNSMLDLKETMRIMGGGFGGVLIIDSITRIWDNYVTAFKKKLGRDLYMQDWPKMKDSWRRDFVNPFINDPYHIIMCGREGYQYDTEINERTKKKEMVKSGVKMRAEGETAHEPNLLLSMETVQALDGGGHIKGVYRQCFVIKDRSDKIDGKVFRNPTYKDLAPAIAPLLGVSSKTYKKTDEADTTALFEEEADKATANDIKDLASIAESAGIDNDKIKEMIKKINGTTTFRGMSTKDFNALTKAVLAEKKKLSKVAEEGEGDE